MQFNTEELALNKGSLLKARNESEEWMIQDILQWNGTSVNEALILISEVIWSDLK